MAAAAEEAGLAILPEERRAPALLHGKLSAYIAERYFGIAAPVVLDAMRCHTTLRTSPTRLDKVLFAADKLSWDPEHAPYIHAMEGALRQGLDQAVRCFLAHGWSRRHQMEVVHPWFAAACEHFAVTSDV